MLSKRIRHKMYTISNRSYGEFYFPLFHATSCGFMTLIWEAYHWGSLVNGRADFNLKYVTIEGISMSTV